MLSLDSIIGPDNIPSFTQRQSKYPQLKGKLPARICMFGKSSAGKGVACVNLLTKFFVDENQRPCFDRYMIVSQQQRWTTDGNLYANSWKSAWV